MPRLELPSIGLAAGAGVSAVLVVVLILSLVILVGNTMLAIAFLRGRRNDLKSSQQGQQDAMDELHRRVQDLAAKHK